MEENVIFVSDCHNLSLRIKVIGYRNQGESVIFEIVENSNSQILYLGCVDSYEVDNTNLTFDYINSTSPKKLDFLCWTHPDDDHSKGMIKIFNECKSDNTIILMPATMDEKLNQSLNLSDRHRQIYDLFDAHNEKNLGTLIGISVRLEEKVEEISFQDGSGNSVSFIIRAIAPNGGIIRDWRRTKKERVKNILSVGLLLEFGKYKFLLGADMIDDSIEQIYAPHLKDPLWRKIPHHGSDTSMLFPKRISFESKNHFACTTAFPSKGLPMDIVLDAYMSNGCSRIDSTHHGHHSHGVLEYDFRLFSDQKVRLSHIGNAVRVRP